MESDKKVKTLPFLTFRLGKEHYALDIFKVKEVLHYTPITRIPRAPSYMCGVINLRGGVVSVVDLSIKFGQPPIEDPSKGNIIILELTYNEENIRLGVLVDLVQEVLDLETAQIEPAPKIGMELSTDFVRGIGKKGDDFLILLDIDRIFSSNDLCLAANSSEKQTVS